MSSSDGFFYTVKKGDSISKIAKCYGVANWQTIYNHPKNQELRDLRPSPDQIYPNDQVWVPNATRNRSAGKSGERLILLKRVPRDRLQICDHDGKPVANAEYELDLDGVRSYGKTDANGWTEKFDSTNVQQGTLSIQKITYEIAFESEELDDVMHAQSLLNALGFNAGPLDGILGRCVKQAISSYQRERSLDITGELNNETINKLKEEHGIA